MRKVEVFKNGVRITEEHIVFDVETDVVTFMVVRQITTITDKFVRVQIQHEIHTFA